MFILQNNKTMEVLGYLQTGTNRAVEKRIKENLDKLNLVNRWDCAISSDGNQFFIEGPDDTLSFTLLNIEKL